MPPQSESRKHTTSHYGSYLFLGTVISVDPGTFVIEVATDGQQNFKRQQGIPLAATFAHALGFKEPMLPNVGARVLCCSGFSGFCIIIGVVPPLEKQASLDDACMPSRASFGADDPIQDPVHSAGYYESLSKAGILNNQLPTDVVQGEKVIANEFGVLLGLFQMMAVLKGSELAQVQCHFLDDLVRIISHNFQHYTALGEHNIFHDGKGLHLEIGMTHDPKEGLGSPQTGLAEPELTIKDVPDDSPSTEFYELNDERLKAIERLKMFVGKLGDLVNILIVAPPDEPRILNGEAPKTPDRGLFQFHAGLDGLLVVRSVKGIVLEKTNWIRVPHRIRTPEDPEGDKGTEINYALRETFGFDDSYTDTYSGTPFLYYLQLRDYLAYIEEDYNYSNFKAHEKDFHVNDDYASETPLDELTYVDPITGASFMKKRSLMALMPNGGLSLSDAWGSAINMEGGNIYIQPAKDLIFQPMRNMYAKVGGSIALTAKKELDLSSTEGGLRVKTNLAQYLYSDQSGIVLHANGPAISDGYAPYDTGEPVDYVAGVVLHSPNAGVTSYGNQIYSKAKNNMVLSGKIVNVAADLALQMAGKQYASLYSDAMMIVSKLQTEIYSSGDVLAIGEGGTVVGMKGQVFGVTKGPIPLPVEGLIDRDTDKDKDFFTLMDKQVDTSGKMDLKDRLSYFKDDKAFDNLKFYFLTPARYGLTDSEVIPQTMTQLEENTVPGWHGLEKWVERAVNDTYPYPGADLAMSFVTTSMQNVEKYADELVNKTTDLVTEAKFAEVLNVFEDYTVSL